MKKILYAAALMAVVMCAFTACKKDNKKDETEEPTTITIKRLKQCGDEWDKYVFTYNDAGKVIDINRNAGEKQWTISSWEGNEIKANYVTRKKDAEGKYTIKDEEGVWTFTFGSNGYLSKLANQWNDTWGLTYDNDGHLTKIVRVDKDNAVKCNLQWSNGNLVKWSRFKDSGAEEWKEQSFTDEDNVGGIFPDMTDKADVMRHWFELGWIGKPSKKLLDEAAWAESTSVATHTYTKDAGNYVTKVEKYYDTELDQTYEYEWEEVTITK